MDANELPSPVERFVLALMEASAGLGLDVPAPAPEDADDATG